MADKQAFLNTYKLVFDKDNNFKDCGREVCKKLITLANEVEPNVSHGNTYSGMVNANLMRSLKEKIESAVI